MYFFYEVSWQTENSDSYTAPWITAAVSEVVIRFIDVVSMNLLCVGVEPAAILNRITRWRKVHTWGQII